MAQAYILLWLGEESDIVKVWSARPTEQGLTKAVIDVLNQANNNDFGTDLPVEINGLDEGEMVDITVTVMGDEVEFRLEQHVVDDPV